ncbi:MAG: amino acid ABC transporter permease [Erysipelotrichaceae bacterium]|nr:amino acid ABC transporter permease [Erysipelotrichaceae bacterium]MBQ9158258.1 amino acid ABC transporter permease [Erysipelotrichaceae bacterium]MBR4484166.1 amino acid ABC transporter permease [Erysipelotrichaceae bacterium]MBR6260243.1 amino acid ABC transporter permease [Erysipelotrichaceae bacterium]MBR6723851.1 amino acid ABC transporter permease [Erysipelotrichaceae bacterium]
MSFSKCIEILIKYHKSFLLGIRTTLIVALIGTLIGLLIGLLAGGIRAIRPDKTLSKGKKALKVFIDLLIKIYIEVFRGTPMMVQAVFIYYLVYTNIVHWDKMVAAIFVISINTGAYMAEIVRAGIQAVDPGQNEAARSLGMSSMQTMMDIVLPQAIRNAFPAIGNELIVNIKDSSVLMIISITELMFQSNSIAGTTYRFTETYFVTAFIYLCLTGISSIILNAIEKKLNHTKTSLPQSDTDVKSISIAKEGL